VAITLAAVLGIGLYLVNRLWIIPLSSRPAAASTGRPIAPDFSLKDIAGNHLNLQDYRGKVVLLDFWATWCGPCRIEIPEFVELQKRYRDQGFSIIGISLDDSIDPVREFYQQFKMNYPVALGDPKLAELYGGILGLPTSLLIGRDGRIYAKHVGATDVPIFEIEIKELLMAQGAAEVSDFKGVGRAQTENIATGDPEEVNSEVPSVNLSELTAEQKQEFKKHLEKIQCTCGCNLNLLRCRIEDRSCAVSLRKAREELKKFLRKPSE
jgi:thiol-disulfide isomerase/thioredoxin